MKLRVAMLLVCVMCISLVSAQLVPKWKITDVVNATANNPDSIYVINFWATFCKPCIEEIPYMDSISFNHSSGKVKLILVSLDFSDSAQQKIKFFTSKNKLNATVVWLDETNADYFCPLIDKSWSGSIPATYFVVPKTGYHKFIESEMTRQTFEAELSKAIGI